MFLIVALFASENARHCHIMKIIIIFEFILGLMDYYNTLENYFPINVKFHFFSEPSLSLPHT